MSSCQDEHFKFRGAEQVDFERAKVKEVCERHNEGKAQLSYNLLSKKAQEGEARVWMHGGKKYARGNWMKGMKWTEAADSLLRHLTDFLNGEDIDPVDTPEGISAGSGLPHIDHIICCAKILAHTVHNYPELDDRS